jgi:hypothetical protein
VSLARGVVSAGASWPVRKYRNAASKRRGVDVLH